MGDHKPILEAAWMGPSRGWDTPQHVPRLMLSRGYDPDLYVCNSSPKLGVVTVDLNRTYRPVVQADMNRLPFKDRSFRCGFFDPPYDLPYVKAVNEMGRVCRDRLAVLHTKHVGLPANREKAWKTDRRVLLLGMRDKQVRCLTLFRRNP